MVATWRWLSEGTGWCIPAEQEVCLLTLKIPQEQAASWMDFEQTAAWQSLTEMEKDRARRYRSAAARIQFVTCRSALRNWLGHCLDMRPAEVPLTVSENGKPVLAISRQTNTQTGTYDEHPPSVLHFNVAHTDGQGIIALARHEVGVDIERVRPIDDIAGLLRRYFTPCEQLWWQRQEESTRLDAFFRLWTCKEAVLKAVGRSLADLNSFVLQLLADSTATITSKSVATIFDGTWQIRSWRQTDPTASFWITAASRLNVSPTIDHTVIRGASHDHRDLIDG
ncbi:MAG: 4'-phosphopantetheinyl transferase superfamily protein [Gemmataceae bacterium]|nr:4'-phosphopantetheinyl transferase superfamily protein [Gemmataceae bacterium]MDW8243181.1 4'-phosphopantetheinyl transferase superfamily protein [Thermogemmata sp.]